MKKAGFSLGIIAYMLISCQLPGESVIMPEETTTTVEVEAVTVEDVFTDPVIAPEEITKEDVVMEYTGITEYHFPAALKGKSIRYAGETEAEFEFSDAGIIRKTPTILFPNPIMPDDFNLSEDGQTKEIVESDGDNWRYSLYMAGSKEYKGVLYFGDLKIDVSMTDGKVLLNFKEAEIF